MMRSAPLIRSKMAVSGSAWSIGGLISSDRSVSARQASGENRSRITEADDCAAATRLGSAPSRSRRCNAAEATSTGLAFGSSVGTASQSPSSEQMRETTRVVASSLSVTRLTSARTSRSVASARST